MLYLTGAQNSLQKSADNPQTDPAKSLGGFISSSPVPNSAINSLFDLVSSYSIQKEVKETIAIGLINKFDFPVDNVRIKIVTDENHECSFKVGAVAVGDNYAMESISSRYQEPIMVDFYNANFYRAHVDLKIESPIGIEEEVALLPFGVTVIGEGIGIEETWRAFSKAFENNETYQIRRIYIDVFRIERIDEEVIEPGIQCSYVATGGFRGKFLSTFENKVANSLLLKETMNPGEALGIWIQRKVRKNIVSNEQLVEEYKKKFVREQVEGIDFIISFDQHVEPEPDNDNTDGGE